MGILPTSANYKLSQHGCHSQPGWAKTRGALLLYCRQLKNLFFQVLVCLTQANDRLDIAPDYSKNPSLIAPQKIKKVQVTFGESLRYPEEPLEFQMANQPYDCIRSFLMFLEIFGFPVGENGTNSISFERYINDFFLICIDMSVLPVSSEFEKGKNDITTNMRGAYITFYYFCTVDADQVRGSLKLHLEYSGGPTGATTLQFYSWGLLQSKYRIDYLKYGRFSFF